VFENRVLRGMFGPEEQVKGGWRKLHRKELLNFLLLAKLIGMIESRRRWAGHVVRESIKSSGKSKGMGPLGIPRHRWQDNIKMVKEG
jgi:hypothetical protein